MLCDFRHPYRAPTPSGWSSRRCDKDAPVALADGRYFCSEHCEMLESMLRENNLLSND